MEATEKEYKKIVFQCRSLFEKKLEDYGSAWRILRLTSLTDQIYIKAQRIRSLQTNKTRKVNEGQESEFIGIINYSIMGINSNKTWTCRPSRFKFLISFKKL